MCNDTNKVYIPVEDIPSDKRIDNLESVFYETFNDEPSFYVRVPGRVNIIGEHIDYCGYPVLPMAIDQDILIAVKVTDRLALQIRNVNSKYTSFDYDIEKKKDVFIENSNNGKPFWYNYVLCGIKGAFDYLDQKIIHGIQIIVDGNIPPASGLSSSSALVSAACLCFLYAHGAKITKAEISLLCAKCERYIGTQGGGMDQAIAFLAEKNCAQYITWKPLKATPVALPDKAVFVVAHCLAEANKAATNDFNQRVMECRFAAKILAHSKNISTHGKIITLSQVQSLLGCSLSEMLLLVDQHLSKQDYSKDEIARLLDIKVSDLEDTYLSADTKHLDKFKLYQRATHVYQEAMRVEEFRNKCLGDIKCNQNGVNGNNGHSIQNGTAHDNTLATLGDLMSKSHESLKTLFECSHENLDRLVELSLKTNVHARLTGAGWGGCIVALCPKDSVKDYVNYLKKEFYEKQFESGDIENCIFITTPSRGAVIFSDKKSI